MDLTGGPTVPSPNSITGSRIGHHELSAPTETATTTIKAIGHDRMQTLGGLLGRHQRSLGSLTMASQRADLPRTGLSQSLGQTDSHAASPIDQQQNPAIAARLLGPTTITTTTTTTTTTISGINQEANRGEIDGSVRHQLEKYVNLELVRDLIVRHSIELAIILVILIYLVYYFSRISRVSVGQDRCLAWATPGHYV